MKILHVNYSDSKGGAAIACSRLVEALNENFTKSDLIVCEKKEDRKYRTLNQFENNTDLVLHKLKKYLSINIKNIIGAKNIYKDSISIFNSGLAKKINNLDYDVINLHWICNEMISIEEIKKIKKPKVWTVVDMWPFTGSSHYTTNNFYKYHNQKFDKNFLFNIENWVLSRKQKNFDKDIVVVCISNWLSNLAKESNVFRENRIFTVPCTIDHTKWTPISKEASRNHLKFEKNKKYFLFSAYNGIADHRKGFDLLLDSLKLLKINRNDFSVVILGNTNGLDEFKKIYDFNYIVYDKHFNDDHEALKLIYSACDIFIMPSRIEAFGQIVLEAGACELPCLTFKTIGAADIIDHKVDGYLADYLDIGDLSRGINFFLNEDNHARISKNIRKKIIEKFSYDVVAKQYEKIYAGLK